MGAAIKRSRAASAITLVKDNTRASIIYSISLLLITLAVFYFHIDFFIKIQKKVVVIRVLSTVVQIIAVN
jgi:hypothetical protein